MTGGTLAFAPHITAEQRAAFIESWESFQPDPDARLVAYMNPRPSLWRDYVRGPVRSAFWVSVGALIVITLAMVGLELGDVLDTWRYHYVWTSEQ